MILAIIVILLLFGGIGYGGYGVYNGNAAVGAPYGFGIGGILIVLLVLYLLHVI